MFEQAARCYEERGDTDCAELMRLVAAFDRKAAEEVRRYAMWSR